MKSERKRWKEWMAKNEINDEIKEQKKRRKELWKKERWYKARESDLQPRNLLIKFKANACILM